MKPLPEQSYFDKLIPLISQRIFLLLMISALSECPLQAAGLH
jgi:hypothetical protein